MTPKTATVNAAAEADRLAGEATEALAKADQARARADEANRRAAAQRESEIAVIRQRRLDAYDDAELSAETRAAGVRFRDAILAGKPGIIEFAAWEAARTKHSLN